MNHIQTLQPHKYALWDNYVRNSPDSSVYQMSGWLSAVAHTYRIPVHFLAFIDEEKIQGVLPLVFINSPLTGKSLVSVPFATSGGLLADSPAIESELISYAEEISVQYNARTIEFRQIERLQSNHLRLDDRYCSYTLPLSEDSNALWEKFNKKVRNQVRNSEKKGFVLQRGIEFLPSFYHVFVDRMRDLGTPVHSIQWFYHLAEYYAQDFEVFTVLDGDTTVGGMFALRHHETFYTLAACSLKSYFRYNPNNFLYWHTIKFACEHGYKTFDFGRSTEGSGTAHFKSQWGAIKEPLFYYSIDTKNKNTQHSSEPGAAARLFIRCWQMIPVTLTRIIGPWFRKRIP